MAQLCKNNEVMEFADAGDLQHLLKAYLGLKKTCLSVAFSNIQVSFLIFTAKLGEDPILTNVFQVGGSASTYLNLCFFPFFWTGQFFNNAG